MTIEQLNSMDGYTFDEGVAFLILCNDAPGVIRHLSKTHNRPELHARIHKLIRIPSISRMLREKGFYKQPMETTAQSNGNVPESHKEGTQSDRNVPESYENGTQSVEPNPNLNVDIVITEDDVRSHKFTRYDDMPTPLSRQLWLKKQDLYREMQQCHLKMRNVPEGDEHNGERARYRAEVLRLDDEIASYWEQIDAEVERHINKSESKDGFDVSTYRAYISKALRKKSLTPAQLAELQHRVDALLAAKVEIKPETLQRLRSIGIK